MSGPVNITFGLPSNPFGISFARDERQLTTPEIIQKAADLMCVTYAELVGASRLQEYVYCRFAVMRYLHEHKGWNNSRIARALGHRDHSTVINGLRRAEGLLASNPDFAAMYRRLMIGMGAAG